MLTLKSITVPSNYTIKPIFSLFSSIPRTPTSNSSLLNYLIETFNFSQVEAKSIINRFPHIKTPERPQSLLQFFQNLGFSEAHIRRSVRVAPQILFSDIDKTLKPKIDLFQDLGLLGSDLGKFISKNSTLLTVSLEKKLIPCIQILKNILANDKNEEYLIRVICRCNRVISIDPELRLLSNIAFLKSCGIVGSQLSMILKRQPRLFSMEESKLRQLVSRVSVMGFSFDSRMFVHGLYTVSCLSEETFDSKLELLRSYGFSENECMDMFRRKPGLLRVSEVKLKLGIELFFNTIEFEKAVLVRVPWCLMLSMEERVIPRYRVLQIVKSKRLLRKEPSFVNVLSLTEEEFVEKFVSRFRDDAEELLVAYKGHLLDSNSCDLDANVHVSVPICRSLDKV